MEKSFKKGMLIIPLAILFLSSIALAQMQGNPANGAALYESCVSCHTLKGKMIAGLPENTLVEKMTAFQNEQRTDNKKILKMHELLKPMSKQDIVDLASYITKM